MQFSEAIEALLQLHRGTAEVKPKLHRFCLVEDGFYIDPDTGVVQGRHLDLDQNTMGHYSPLYYYNRSWRFIGLFSIYSIHITDQGTALEYFERLEKAWEDTKSKYTRVYFLTQKLLLQQICTRLGIASMQPAKRPISDLKRYRAQIDIFNDLWKIVVRNKCLNSTSVTNNFSDSTLRTVSCR